MGDDSTMSDGAEAVRLAVAEMDDAQVESMTPDQPGGSAQGHAQQEAQLSLAEMHQAISASTHGECASAQVTTSWSVRYRASGALASRLPECLLHVCSQSFFLQRIKFQWQAVTPSLGPTHPSLWPRIPVQQANCY